MIVLTVDFFTLVNATHIGSDSVDNHEVPMSKEHHHPDASSLIGSPGHLWISANPWLSYY